MEDVLRQAPRPGKAAEVQACKRPMTYELPARGPREHWGRPSPPAVAILPGLLHQRHVTILEIFDRPWLCCSAATPMRALVAPRCYSRGVF